MNDGQCCETCKWWFPIGEPEELARRRAEHLSILGACRWCDGRNIPSCVGNPDFWDNFNDCGVDCPCWEAKAV